jgi:O-antigen ligase
MHLDSRWHGRAENGARWLVVASAFVVSLPAAWISLSTVLFLAAWLLSGRYADRWLVMRRHPLAWISLLLLGWMALAITWSPAGLRPAVEAWWKYRELLLLPLMLSVIAKDDETARVWQQRVLHAFLAGFAISLAVSYLRRAGLLPLLEATGQYAGFGGHVGFSVMLAFVAYVCWQRASHPGSLRLGWAFFGLACVLNLFLINTGRTGQAGFLALVPLALHRWIGWRGILASLLAVPLLAASVYFASPVVHQRVDQSVADVVGFRAGNTESNDGLRMDFWVHSLGFIRESPLFGAGTGGYIVKYRQAAEQEGLPASRVNDNPHNEYLLIASQQGLIGLALLLALWGAQWSGAAGLAVAERDTTRALLLLMVTGDCFNSFLLDNLEGHFYLLLTVALCARWPLRLNRAGAASSSGSV